MTIESSPLPVKFELGCNYWPRKSAMYMWRQLDMGEVRADFAHLRDLGMAVVRFFLLTEDFLPAAMTVPKERLEDLVDVARAASDAGLRSIPTVITINMSGKFWWPAWMCDAHGAPKNLFSDPILLGSQARLAASCASALAGDRSIRAFDLSNEIDDAQRVPSRNAVQGWLALLAGEIRRAAPGISVQCGAHLPSLTANTHMRIDDIAEVVDDDCMHAYPLYSDLARGFLDPELVPFSCALTSALARKRRATYMQEFGICTAPMDSAGITINDDFLGHARQQYLASEAEGARYYEQVLRRLVATGAAGAYAWCYGDYDPKLFGLAPFDAAIRERTFGLVRADGTEKPVCAVIRQFAARLARGEFEIGAVPSLYDGTVDAYYSAAGANCALIYERWLTTHC